jgi:hypothetical protein
MPANSFYNPTGTPGTRGPLSSAAIRAEFLALQTAFGKFPVLTGGALKAVRVNAGETGLEVDPAAYLTAATGVAKSGDTMSGQLVLANAQSSSSVLALLNMQVLQSHTSGLTSIAMGDAGSYINMLQRSKRTVNTASFVINSEYGYGVAVKSAEFYRDAIDLYVAGLSKLTLTPSALQSTNPVYAPYYFFGTGLATDAGELGFAGGSGPSVGIAGSSAGNRITFNIGTNEAMRVDGGRRLLIGAVSSTLGTNVEIWDTLGFPSGNGLKGIVSGTADDTFIYDGDKTVHHYGLQWKALSDAPSGRTVLLSGYGGVRLIAGGQVGLHLTALRDLLDKDNLELGWKDLVRLGTVTDGASLTRAVRGKCVSGPFTSLSIQSGVFAQGDAFAIFNTNTVPMSLVQGSGVTMRLAGTTTTGSRILAPKAMAAVWLENGNEPVVGGPGVS